MTGRELLEFLLERQNENLDVEVVILGEGDGFDRHPQEVIVHRDAVYLR